MRLDDPTSEELEALKVRALHGDADAQLAVCKVAMRRMDARRKEEARTRTATPEQYRHPDHAKAHLSARARVEQYLDAISKALAANRGDRVPLVYARQETALALKALDDGNVDAFAVAFERILTLVVQSGCNTWVDAKAQQRRSSKPRATRKDVSDKHREIVEEYEVMRSHAGPSLDAKVIASTIGYSESTCYRAISRHLKKS